MYQIRQNMGGSHDHQIRDSIPNTGKVHRGICGNAVNARKTLVTAGGKIVLIIIDYRPDRAAITTGFFRYNYDIPSIPRPLFAGKTSHKYYISCYSCYWGCFSLCDVRLDLYIHTSVCLWGFDHCFVDDHTRENYLLILFEESHNKRQYVLIVEISQNVLNYFFYMFLRGKTCTNHTCPCLVRLSSESVVVSNSVQISMYFKQVQHGCTRTGAGTSTLL